MAYALSQSVTVNTTDTLIAKPAARRYVGIQNQDAANPVYLKFNGAEAGPTYNDPATADANCILVAAGEFYHIERPTRAISGEIRGISTGAAVNICLIQD